MGLVLTIVQLLIALILIATTMPVILARVPGLRDSSTGPLVLVGGVIVLFVLIRLVWPRRKV